MMIVDSDAGTDPDDTLVAILIARHATWLGAGLMVSNDETSRFAKARFIAHVMTAAGGRVPVAAGLPSLKRRKTDLAESAGLVPELEIDRDAVAKIVEVLSANDRVEYLGLGALTNLDAALQLRPELAERVRLFQMGPAVFGGFARPRAQYNARIDPAAFRRVLERVPMPTLIPTHTTWGPAEARLRLGVYPDDELARRSGATDRADLTIYAAHLAAFVASGKDCSILHDPATLLASREPELFDLVEMEVVIDDEGWLHLTAETVGMLLAIDPVRTAPVAAALDAWRAPPHERALRARMSLGADHARIRARVIELLGIRRAPT